MEMQWRCQRIIYLAPLTCSFCVDICLSVTPVVFERTSPASSTSATIFLPFPPSFSPSYLLDLQCQPLWTPLMQSLWPTPPSPPRVGLTVRCDFPCSSSRE